MLRAVCISRSGPSAASRPSLRRASVLTDAGFSRSVTHYTGAGRQGREGAQGGRSALLHRVHRKLNIAPCAAPWRAPPSLNFHRPIGRQEIPMACAPWGGDCESV
eukprot:8548539-Pyramimonas_sp.AAC.1